MRARPFALAACLLLPALASSAAAHEGHFQHVNPRIGTLPPGEVETFELEFEEGPFEAGWVFLLSARVLEGKGAPVAALRYENRSVANWTIAPGAATRHLAGLMPHNGHYNLTITNPTNESVRLAFFYDQSCNCAGKPIPAELPDGMVVFNADVKKGATWKATFPEPSALNLTVTLAKRVGERSLWPQDFRLLQRSQQAVVRDVGAGPARLHELTWTADEDARYYFFVESTGVNYKVFLGAPPEQRASTVFVTPFFEQMDVASRPAPLGAEVALGALALAAALGLARRRR